MNQKKVSIKSVDEVLAILEGIFQSRTHLELGQDFDNIIKKSWSIIENINKHSFDLAIRPTDRMNLFNFDSKSKISISTSTEAVQFDVKLKKLNHKNLIIVEMPKELELISTRLAKRIPLEHLNAEISYKNSTIKSYRKRKEIMKAKLEAVSENGISYILLYDHNLGFSYGDKISINSINKYSLSSKLDGKIVYLQDFKKDRLEESYTKVGVKFDNKIELQQVLGYLNNAYYLNKMVA